MKRLVKVCREQGCRGHIKSRGLCSKHYMQELRQEVRDGTYRDRRRVDYTPDVIDLHEQQIARTNNWAEATHCDSCGLIVHNWIKHDSFHRQLKSLIEHVKEMS